MAKPTKRMRAIAEKVDAAKFYPIAAAVDLLAELSTAKFKESFEVAVNLGVDVRKSDQTLRGASTLPHGTGKSVRVAVFAQGDNAAKAEAVGADVVGLDDLAERIKGGDLNFDVVVATPDAMRVVGQLGRLLGPRGLMPQPEDGNRHRRRRDGGEKRQGGAGSLPHRPGRHRPRQRRAGGLLRRPDQGERGNPGVGPEEGAPRRRPRAFTSRRSRFPPPWDRVSPSISPRWRCRRGRAGRLGAEVAGQSAQGEMSSGFTA